MKLVLLFCFFSGTLSSDILFVSYAPQWSHQSVLRPVYRELSLKGHKVTALTIFPYNDPSLTNLTEIDWSHNYRMMKDVLKVDQRIQQEKMSVELFKYAMGALRNITQENLSSQFVKDLIADKSRKFDLVLIEAYGFSYYAFAEKFDCPIVLLASMPGTRTFYHLMGVPDHPVLYPDINTGLVGQLSFFQRIYSVIYNIWYERLLRSVAETTEAMKKVHFGEDVPTIEEMSGRVSLFISTVVPVFHSPRALVPNFVTVNGLHISPPKPVAKVNASLIVSLDILSFCRKLAPNVAGLEYFASENVGHLLPETNRSTAQVDSYFPMASIVNEDNALNRMSSKM